VSVRTRIAVAGVQIAEKTMKTPSSNILQKLGVEDRTQAAVLASRRFPVQ